MQVTLKDGRNRLKISVLPGTRSVLFVLYVRTFHGNVEPIVSKIFHSLGAPNFLISYTVR
jgi:hypothetical protein